jgi:hypothetical protein
MPEVYLTVIGEFPEKLLEMPVFSGGVWGYRPAGPILIKESPPLF